MKNILVILGHPVADTFSNSVLDAYVDAAESTGATVEVIRLRDLQFDLNFSAGYRGHQELEPDLQMAQDKLRWAEHLVLIYPNWWSTFPALLKGFIDRTLLPGFAFKYNKGLLNWEKRLQGRSARVIVTMDTPLWYYRWYLRRPGHHAMGKGILGFCGYNPVRFTTIGPLKKSTDNRRRRWLKQVRRIGERQI